ncbi:MAG TPA: DegV family protein [Candidatus Bathyarchaeia archaeon]|nr:DegV family protein [Candidatus Bathyarchaeia archaeon]
MTEKLKKYSFLCPFCKDVISFELSEEELKKRYSGGLANIIIEPHGTPPHSVTVYIDKQGLIRSVYSSFETLEPKISLQNSYITDATSEINLQEAQALGIQILPFTISIDGSPHRKYNEEIFFPEVYESLIADKSVKSLPVSVDSFLNAFRNAPQNKPIITLTISKRYSEGYTNAMKAKEIFEKEQPEKAKNLIIIDSKTTGPMMKLMIMKAIELDEKGENLTSILDYLYWICEKHISYIYVDSLNALRKSERVGRVTTFFGNLLGLKPVIIENENNNGDLKAFKTVRSKADAIKEITKAILKEFGKLELIGVIFYGIIIDDAKQLQETLNQESGAESYDFTMDFIGTGVAIHLSYDLLGISLYPKL